MRPVSTFRSMSPPPALSSPALEALACRGRGLRLFIDRVAERGGIAETEIEDLALVRALYVAERAALQARRAA